MRRFRGSITLSSGTAPKTESSLAAGVWLSLALVEGSNSGLRLAAFVAVAFE